MDGVVGRGTLLAGRYRTQQPIPSDLPGATSWEATDQILDRPVRVTILHGGDVPQALDAARRAALVTDPRLVRILDVGEHEGVAYTVTEQVTGPSLAELAGRAPLPADQARAVIGEAAAALEAARRRGVHHLALRPSVIHLTVDDRVLVTGLAVDGALLGREPGPAAAASRADTVALVALLYGALTGRWPTSVPTVPGDAAPSGTRLPAAPVLQGAPVPPAELTSGVPNDLDTLCAVTLGVHDDGPHTPAELVQELEPWGDIRTTDLFAATEALPTVSAPPTAPMPTVAAAPAQPARVQRTSVRSAFAGQPSTASRPGTPPPAVPTRSSALSGPAVGQAAPPAAGTQARRTGGSTAVRGAAGAAAAGAAAAGAAGAAAAGAAGAAAARSAAGASPAGAVPGAVAGAAGAAGSPAGRPGDRAPDADAPRAARPSTGPDAPTTALPRAGVAAPTEALPAAGPDAAAPDLARSEPRPAGSSTMAGPPSARPGGSSATAAPLARPAAPTQPLTPATAAGPADAATASTPAMGTTPLRPADATIPITPAPPVTPATSPTPAAPSTRATPSTPAVEAAPATASVRATTPTAAVPPVRPPAATPSSGPAAPFEQGPVRPTPAPPTAAASGIPLLEDDDEPPGARDTIAAHRFDPTRFVLLLVVVAIVVGLFAAYRSLTRPVDLTVDGPGTDVSESAPPAAEEPAPEPAPEEPAPEAPAGAPTIASATQLDPPPGGDENEHPEAVPLAIDGDPATSWFTRTYNRPDFGGLKPGVGYAVTLAQPATVTTVTLQVQGSGGRVEVRATDPATPTEGDVLAEGTLGPETVLTLSTPTETQHVVLWFTELPRAADGANRLELAEVTVS